MAKKIVNANLLAVLLVLVGLIGYSRLTKAGSLDPPASPAPTMKTLNEVYAAASSAGNTYMLNAPYFLSGTEFAADDRSFIAMYIGEYPGSGIGGYDGLEDSSKVLNLEHSGKGLYYDTKLGGVHQPIDSTTGGPSGVRVHYPVRIVKNIDKATPGLHKACATGVNLSEVVFDFYRIDPVTRVEVAYYKMTLRNARVVDIGPTTNFITPTSYRHMERVSFAYEEIEWNWIPDSVVETDQWQAPGGS